MSKQHRDFVTYVRNGVEINALVAFSRDVFTPATQTVPASTVEHLTVVYLDPNVGGGIPTGEALRNSIKIQMDVPPLAEGLVNGWKEAEDASDAADKLSQANAEIEQQAEKLANADKLAVEQDKRITDLEAELQTALKDSRSVPPDGNPTAADLDAVAAEEKAKEATAVGAPLSVPHPSFETKQYADGSTATGLGPLPDNSPAEQQAMAAAQQGPGDPAAENQATSTPPTE